MSPTGHVEAWNPAAEAIFGWTAAEAMEFPSIGFMIPTELWGEIERLADAASPLREGGARTSAGLSKLDWRLGSTASSSECDLPSADRNKLLSRLLANLLMHHKPVASLNMNITKDGRFITCEWLNIPLFDATGSATGFLWVVQDVSERTRAETALERANCVSASS
jgi:PAS domain-containing protein